MKYAVLFKAHFWDEDVARQYARLVENTKNGDVFVVIDLGAGKEGHFPKNLKRFEVRLSDAKDVGLLTHGGFWVNGDYQGSLFFLKYPEYDYYVNVEYDVATFTSIDDIIEDMDRNFIDAIYEDIDQPLSQWPHLAGCLDYYDFRDIEKGLFCISFFSRRAMAAIYARRVALSREKVKNGYRGWPFCEAVIASEVKIGHMSRRKLSEYCSNLSYYNWNKGMTEDFVSHIAPHNTFLHPVSGLEKCITSNLTPEIRKVDDDLLEKAKLIENFRFFTRIYNLPDNTQDDKARVFDAARVTLGKNPAYSFLSENIISEKGIASQSSLSSYSVNKEEAERALRKLPRGTFSFHTQKEDSPFWEVDLGCVYKVINVYIFDRPDINRSDFLCVSVGEDKTSLRDIFQNDGSLKVGSLLSEPLSLKNIEKVRYVRISIKGKGILHLDSVIVTTPS